MPQRLCPVEDDVDDDDDFDDDESSFSTGYSVDATGAGRGWKFSWFRQDERLPFDRIWLVIKVII